MTPRVPDLAAAATAVEAFAGQHLTRRIAALEAVFAGVAGDQTGRLLSDQSVSHDLLESARVLKRAAGQIHVVIHTVGILLCLPMLLEPLEIVEYLSLGAGNTGKSFDLETDRQVAEFKFINWQGGSETIRQNSLFKDFFMLAESDTRKRKVMYVLESAYPLKFLRSGRALESVFSKQPKLLIRFRRRFGTAFETVGDYYAMEGSAVELVPIGHLLSQSGISLDSHVTAGSVAPVT